jgi:hypothetical protein
MADKQNLRALAHDSGVKTPENDVLYIDPDLKIGAIEKLMHTHTWA